MIYLLENGQRSPSKETLVKLCFTLGLSESEVVNGAKQTVETLGASDQSSKFSIRRCPETLTPMPDMTRSRVPFSALIGLANGWIDYMNQNIFEHAFEDAKVEEFELTGQLVFGPLADAHQYTLTATQSVVRLSAEPGLSGTPFDSNRLYRLPHIEVVNSDSSYMSWVWFSHFCSVAEKVQMIHQFERTGYTTRILDSVLSVRWLEVCQSESIL